MSSARFRSALWAWPFINALVVRSNPESLDSNPYPCTLTLNSES